LLEYERPEHYFTSCSSDLQICNLIWGLFMRILYSTSRIALRSHVLKEIKHLIANRPEQRVILLVPEQTKMDMERDLLIQIGRPAMMMAEILSFRRLAWRLLSEVGRQPRAALDRVGQGMLIHAILTQNKQQLHSFGHLADRPGFINQVAAALGDVRRYNLKADDLSDVAGRVPDQALKNKLSDLAVLLAGYEQQLADTGLCDAEDDLTRLGELLVSLVGLPRADWPWPLSRISWLKNTEIWISGFAETRDFTPQESIILSALNQIGGQMTLTVATDAIPFDGQAIEMGSDSFLIGRKVIWRLLKEHPTSQVEKIIAPETGWATAISSAILTGGRLNLPKERNWLKLVQAGDMDDELSWIAGEIRRLVQEDGFRYRDITLAVCDLKSYGPRLRAVFREYEIPLFLDTERPVSGSPLIRFVLSLLDAGLFNWPLASVMTCLRSGMTPLTLTQIDSLENELLARGVNRKDRLFDIGRYDNQEVLPWIESALVPLRDFLETMDKTPDCEGKCRLLYQCLLTYGIPSRLEQRATDLLAADETDLAVVQIQAWNELVRVLQQMTRLAGATTMSLATFRDLLAAGLDTALINVIPTAIDQVSVGDLQRAVLRQSRILFVVGASADQLPPRLPPEGLLKDQDRQAMAGLLRLQMPSSARGQAFVNAFTIYTLLTLPDSRLYLSVVSDPVSPWFKWLKDAAPECLVRIDPRPGWDDPRLNATGPAFTYLVNQSSCSGRLNSGWLAVGLVLLRAGLPIAAATDWLRSAVDPANNRRVRIDRSMVRALSGEWPAMSVSQLEKYAGCPFAHLADYLLALQERPVWAPEAAETGILLHGIIELALADLSVAMGPLDPADRAQWTAALDGWLEQDLEKRITAWMRTVADRDGLQVFFEDGVHAYSGRRVRRLAASSLTAMLRHYNQDGFKPARLEWRFGPKQKDQFAIDLSDGMPLALRGKVDRIDIIEQEGSRRFRVVDFKSGDRRIDYDGIYHGLALQLPIYLEAYGRNNPAYQAEDAAYFRFARPILSLPAGAGLTAEAIFRELEKSFVLRGFGLNPEEIGLIRRHAIRRARELAERLFGGCFDILPAKLPNSPPACKYCGLKALCGFDENPAGFYRLAPLRSGKKQTLLHYLRALESESRGINS
jgi:ATP-dependent helicase/nuclease subunit B